MIKTSPQRYARITGALLLLSMVAGAFGEVYVPSQLVVSSDAAATAKNLIDSNLLFRAGFASYLVEALSDVALALLFYVLLRPVRRDIALLSAFFGLLGTAVFAFAELFYLAPLLLTGNPAYMKAFSTNQIEAFMLLSLQLYGYGAGVFMVFYGVACVLRGYLILRSTYLPKLLGALLALAGLGFIVKSFLLVLAPMYVSNVLLFPMFIAGASLTLWLLVKGVDVNKWQIASPRDLSSS